MEAGVVARIGGPGEVLSQPQITDFVRGQLDAVPLDGKSVCVLVPDGTRTCPMPLLLGAVHAALDGRASRLTVLVALGTHSEMSEQALAAHLGYQAGAVAGRYPRLTVLNHRWADPRTFATLGSIAPARVADLSRGLLREAVPVRINRAVVEHDIALVVGPVFPHEVVGFSGGNKYFFPGIGGAEIINFTHWLGAVITNYEVIGAGYTPVRAVIDRAASLIQVPTTCFSLVVTHEGLVGLYYGTAPEAWKAASALSPKVHIKWVDRAY